MAAAGGQDEPGLGPVRPYVLTGGRAATRYALAVDSLLRAVPGRPALRGDAAPQTRALLRLYQGGILSLAEAAAHLELPVSVTAVLVEDLIDSGHLQEHAPARFADPTVDLLQEVLDGLQRL